MADQPMTRKDMNPYEHSVVDVCVRIHGALTGTGDGMPDEELCELSNWLACRVASWWNHARTDIKAPVRIALAGLRQCGPGAGARNRVRSGPVLFGLHVAGEGDVSMADRIELRDGWRIECEDSDYFRSLDLIAPNGRKQASLLIQLDPAPWEHSQVFVHPDGCQAWAVAELLKAGGVEVGDG